MAVLLGGGVAGAVIRHEAPNPSTLRDIGTLMLVMWLPAVGNLVAYLISKVKRRPRLPEVFEPVAAFAPNVLVLFERLPLTDGFIASIDPAEVRATLAAGRQGFTVRMQQPVAQWLSSAPGDQAVPLELLSPKLALRWFKTGTTVHLLVGATPVAKGVVA